MLSSTWDHVNTDGNTELIKIFLSQVGSQVSLLCNVEHKLMLTEEQRTKTRRTSCLLQSRGAKDNNYGPPEWAHTWKWAGSLGQTQRNHCKTHVGQTHSVKQRWAHKEVKPQVSDISSNPDGSIKHLLHWDTPENPSLTTKETSGTVCSFFPLKNIHLCVVLLKLFFLPLWMKPTYCVWSVKS